jgi:hypothetical protein
VNARGGVIVAAALMLTCSCGNATREGEIACQRRLVALTDAPIASPRQPGEREFATLFATTSRSFEHMPLDGCNEDQRARAQIMARVSRNLSNLAARVGDVRRQLEQSPDLRSNETFLELQAGIEQFENRRQVLREDLDRMVRQGAD